MNTDPFPCRKNSRTEFIVWENASYMKRGEKSMWDELGDIEGCDREAFASWDWESKAIAVLRD